MFSPHLVEAFAKAAGQLARTDASDTHLVGIYLSFSTKFIFSHYRNI